MTDDNLVERLRSYYTMFCGKPHFSNKLKVHRAVDLHEAADRIERLTAEVAGLRAGWQPIETAPRDEWVLVYCPQAAAGTRRRCHVDARLAKYGWRWAGCRPSEMPTHWMPRPEPPALQGDKP